MPRKNLRWKLVGCSNELRPITSARFFNHSASLNAFAKDLFLGKFNKVNGCMLLGVVQKSTFDRLAAFGR